MMNSCQHCGLACALARRALCRSCYACRSIRKQYSPETRNRQDRNRRTRRLPRRPTTALPGSEAKILVFQQRLAQRRSLFHPLDA